MKALVFTAPNEMTYREEDEPDAEAAVAAGDVIVDVAHCGICGSDMHAYHGADLVRRPPPLILGHEGAGTIIAGEGEGTRVTINPLIGCGVCDHCVRGDTHLCAKRRLLSMKGAPGAFAERVRVPSANCVAIPDGLSTALAALTEPLAVCHHAVSVGARWLTRPVSEARAVVVGGGAIGLGTALVLAARGVRDIALAETLPARRERLARFDAFRVYDPTVADADRPDDSSAELVFDAFGGGR
ncbi:MAG: alcohol dehydrogenase catalytic domain-containing protein, partial [Pseudomonadota bacterium]